MNFRRYMHRKNRIQRKKVPNKRVLNKRVRNKWYQDNTKPKEMGSKQIGFLKLNALRNGNLLTIFKIAKPYFVSKKVCSSNRLNYRR